MESQTPSRDPRHDAEAAESALAELADDREQLAGRFMSETWWGAPAQGAATAVLIASPAAGPPWSFLLSAAAVLALGAIEHSFRRRTGLAVKRPAGPIGRLLLVLAVVVMAGGFAASLALTLAGARGWVGLIALAGFVLTTAVVVAYDRVYAHEVRRVR